MTAILDTSFLFALTDRSDRNHDRVLGCVRTMDELTIVPVTVLPEICYLLASRLGHKIMRKFVFSLTSPGVEVESITVIDLVRSHEILEHYGDSELDFTDATIVAIAERLKVTRIGTLDCRDFSIVRPVHCPYFELLP